MTDKQGEFEIWRYLFCIMAAIETVTSNLMSAAIWLSLDTKPMTEAAVAMPSVYKVTVLSVSQTGNGRKMVGQLMVKPERVGIQTDLVDTGDYKSK
ncbi:hypothetical protein PT286_00155 [Neisseriaceae bacterium ESL0693]|nr:hypothetical protein [Neisseriaceae bacterium ESL0693]